MMAAIKTWHISKPEPRQKDRRNRNDGHGLRRHEQGIEELSERGREGNADRYGYAYPYGKAESPNDLKEGNPRLPKEKNAIVEESVAHGDWGRKDVASHMEDDYYAFPNGNC